MSDMKMSKFKVHTVLRYSVSNLNIFVFIYTKDFVTTITRLLESPSTFIRAKAFLVLLQVLINNREMLLLSCQTR